MSVRVTIVFGITFLLAAANLAAQNTFPQSGNVGIGTTNPAVSLHVIGTVLSQPGLFQVRNQNTNHGWTMGASGGGSQLVFVENPTPTTSNVRMLLDRDGLLGLGTTHPTERLHVVGGILSQPGLFEMSNAGTHRSWRLDTANGGARFQIQSRTPSGTNLRFLIDEDGNAGLGTTHPTERLHVVGGILSQPGLFEMSNAGTHRSWRLDTANGGARFQIQSRTPSGTDLRFLIDEDGNAGLGTASPHAKLEIQGSPSERNLLSVRSGNAGEVFSVTHSAQGSLTRAIDLRTNFLRVSDVGPVASPNAVDSHIASITNARPADPHETVNGLAIDFPGTMVFPEKNFITFFGLHNDGSHAPVGAIEGSGGEGVTYKTGSADFAEWLPKASPDEDLRPGDVVGVTGGKVSRDTREAQQVQVVSTAPAVLGNSPPAAAESRWAEIAFVGQVPVRVSGPVRAGDFLIPSGHNDGTAVGRVARALGADDLRCIVGRAWQSHSGSGKGTVRAVVGLQLATPLLQDLREEMLARIGRLEARLDALEQRSAAVTTSAGLAGGEGFLPRNRR